MFYTTNVSKMFLIKHQTYGDSTAIGISKQSDNIKVSYLNNPVNKISAPTFF